MINGDRHRHDNDDHLKTKIIIRVPEILQCHSQFRIALTEAVKNWDEVEKIDDEEEKDVVNDGIMHTLLGGEDWRRLCRLLFQVSRPRGLLGLHQQLQRGSLSLSNIIIITQGNHCHHHCFFEFSFSLPGDGACKVRVKAKICFCRFSKGNVAFSLLSCWSDR